MLKEYLKSKAAVIGLFAFWALFIGGWFFFNSLDMNALTYPFCMTGIVGVIFLIVGYRRTKAKHDQIRMISDFVDVAGHLPEPSDVTERDLTDLIERLDGVFSERVSSFNNRTKDTDDYYTMWVHQIKTPISAMKLKLDSMDTDEAAVIKSQLLRIEQYVEMVLIYRRLESSESDYRFKEAELDEIVREAVRKFRTEFINKHLTLRYEVEPLKIMTDEKWLTFVIEQLLSNSLKYTNKGYIRLSVDDGCLVIEDSGIGILEEDIPRIFDKGYTGYNGRLDKCASGIGLYLCKRICDNLGYKISVSSKVGEGTSVRISLTRPDRTFE